MRTYLLNLYYPNLKQYARNVRMAKEFAERVAGQHNWRMLKAGENLCSIAFATDADPRDFQGMARDMGEEHFQYLLVEVSATHAGWTDPAVYEWLRGRLHRG